ncbi:hypothetical protein ABZW47_31075 [Streptomyces sp. NPDC004549]|uniref:hypothetical protein n=1 Tax=Streptomyces sp. NPDC004549 TaxID=3154283 RepID=UPI0033BDB7E8
MHLIEDGLYTHDKFAYGPLAEAALHRTAEARQRLERIQDDPAALTDAQLLDEVYRVLRQTMQRVPQAAHVESMARQIRQGTRYEWPTPHRLAIA